MALLAPDSTRVTSAPWLSLSDVGALAAMLRLLTAVWATESVRKVKISADAGQLDLWVLLDAAAEHDESRIIALWRDYRSTVGPLPVELHLHSLTDIDEDSLPVSEPVLER